MAFEPSEEREGAFRNTDPHLGEHGALAHLLPEDWGPYRPSHFDVWCPGGAELRRLNELARDPEKLDQELARLSLERFADGNSHDVVVVDLALSLEQQIRLIEEGGNLVARDGSFVAENGRRVTEDPNARPEDLAEIADAEAVQDLREIVQDLTGFRVVSLLSSQRTPVISTTYARNPLVRKQLRENGAFAVVQKPVTSKEMAHATRRGIRDLERRAHEGTDAEAVVVMDYLMSIAAEVLKAAVSVGVRFAASTLPPGMSTDPIRSAG
ncbi:MAG TPA: hypothetical protein VF250_14960 [Conexibacter sp.]